MKREGTKRLDSQSTPKTNNVAKVGASELDQTGKSGILNDQKTNTSKSNRPMSGISRSITQKKPSHASLVTPQSGEKPALIAVKSLKEENNSILDGKSRLTNHNSDIESGQAHSRRDKKEQDDLLMDSDDNELVKLGVDMSQLSDYMDNIVKVVNQHAKLLDNVSDELDLRPHQTNVGELFAVLTLGFPYEKLLKQLGFSSHPPRNSKVIESLTKHKIQINQPLTNQLDQPVTDMFEGMERFLKIIELLGKSSIEAKDF